MRLPPLGMVEAEGLFERDARELRGFESRIREAWDELDTEMIRKWLRELRPRLKKIVEKNGRQIYFNKI